MTIVRTPKLTALTLAGILASSLAPTTAGVAQAGASVQATPPPTTPPTMNDVEVAAADAAVAVGGTGAFKASMSVDPTLPTHTIYAPRDLAAATRDGPLPIVAWGNGACINYGNRFRYFLTEIASHGYVVIAIGPPGPHEVESRAILPSAPTPQDAVAQTQATQLTDAIDWAVREAARPGSRFHHRLDPARIAVMGQSCGGLQAIYAAADPRVRVAAIWNSGTFPPGSKPLAGTGGVAKADLMKLHAPIAYISGDESDIAFKNAQADFEAIHGVPALRAYEKGVGHTATYREPSGGAFAPVGIAWLDWQLKGSAVGRAEFLDPGCRLCRDPRWTVRAKDLR